MEPKTDGGHSERDPSKRPSLRLSRKIGAMLLGRRTKEVVPAENGATPTIDEPPAATIVEAHSGPSVETTHIDPVEALNLTEEEKMVARMAYDQIQGERNERREQGANSTQIMLGITSDRALVSIDAVTKSNADGLRVRSFVARFGRLSELAQGEPLQVQSIENVLIFRDDDEFSMSPVFGEVSFKYDGGQLDQWDDGRIRYPDGEEVEIIDFAGSLIAEDAGDSEDSR